MLFEYPISKNIVSKEKIIIKFVKAILLAAGKGTRLSPLTAYRPKHLLEIAGKSILKRLIDSLLEIEMIDEIIVVVHFQADLISDTIQKWYRDKNLEKINIITQKEPNGTGDAVSTAIKMGEINNDFIVVYGDLLVGSSLINILASYSENPNRGYILGTSVDNPEKYGILDLQNGKLKSIIEKPLNAPDDTLINAGIYIFPKIAVDLINKIKPSSRNEIELTDLIQLIVNSGIDIKVIVNKDEWFDIGYPWELLNANETLMMKEMGKFTSKGEVEENVTLIGKVHIAKNARVRSGSYIEGPVFIDEGADIGPNCYIRGTSYIGKNVRIGNACEIKNSIIYSNTHAAHLSYVGDSIIGENCNLGAGTITANLRHDKKGVKVIVKSSRIDTGRRKLGAIIGDNVKIGISVNILPGIKIDSDLWINAGVTLSRDQKK
ncbi:MAG: Bifunctional protein GlmU [Candidatus Heimdallarchaeota archaeon LC_2]|nr:MAG: Bifunctional protein GlmU [Candidatus Heimdallarchaeota archaeon LC_2]